MNESWSRAADLAKDLSLIEKSKITLAEVKKAKSVLQKQIQSKLCQINRLSAAKSKAERRSALAHRAQTERLRQLDFKEECQHLNEVCRQTRVRLEQHNKQFVGILRRSRQKSRYIMEKLVANYKDGEVSAFKQKLRREKQINRQIARQQLQQASQRVRQSRLSRTQRISVKPKCERASQPPQSQAEIRQLIELAERRSQLQKDVAWTAEEKSHLEQQFYTLAEMRRQFYKRKRSGG